MRRKIQWRDCHRDLCLLGKCSHALMTPDISGLLQGTTPFQDHDALLPITTNQFTKSNIQDKPFLLFFLDSKCPRDLSRCLFRECQELLYMKSRGKDHDSARIRTKSRQIKPKIDLLGKHQWSVAVETDKRQWSKKYLSEVTQN